MSESTDSRHTAAVIVAAAIAALAVALRFYQLDARLIHWDEGVHGYYAWRFAVEGEFVYEPWRHGPLLYYLSAPALWLVGDSIVVGRAVVAAVSLAMFPALYLLRRDLPRSALLFSAMVLAVHPYVLQTARFYRNDAMLATFCLLLVALYARYRRTPSRPWAIGLGAIAGLAFATKEAAFLLVPAIALPIVVIAHFDGRFTGRGIRELAARYAPLRHVPSMAAACLLVLIVLYSNWPPNPAEVTGFIDGLRFWLDQGGSGSGEVTFYVDRLVVATPGLAALAAVGAVGTVVRTDSSWLRWLFLSWGAVVTAVLSLIADQSSWNVLLVFPPVAVLAGCGAHDAFLALRRVPGPIALDGRGAARSAGVARAVVRTVAPVSFALLLVTAEVVAPNPYVDADVANELEVVGVTEPPVIDHRERAYTLAREHALEGDCRVLVGPGEQPWPGPWWLRDLDPARFEEWNDAYGPAVVIDTRPIPALEGEGYRKDTVAAAPRHGHEEWVIYAPEGGCSGG